MQMRKHFDWFIPRQTEDFMSYGCCGMGQAYKPSGLHCRGVTVYVDIYGQIYADSESNANLFAIAVAQQYKFEYPGGYIPYTDVAAGAGFSPHLSAI